MYRYRAPRTNLRMSAMQEGRRLVFASYQNSAACAKIGSFLSSRYSSLSTFTTVSERGFSAAFLVGKKAAFVGRVCPKDGSPGGKDIRKLHQSTLDRGIV